MLPTRPAIQCASEPDVIGAIAGELRHQPARCPEAIGLVLLPEPAAHHRGNARTIARARPLTDVADQVLHAERARSIWIRVDRSRAAAARRAALVAVAKARIPGVAPRVQESLSPARR